VNLITVEVGGAKLVLAPEIGGSIAGWTRHGTPMMRAAAAEALNWREPRDLSSYPLFPYSNRVAGRCFRFDGESYSLPDLLGGHAIHGAGWRLPWAAIQDGPSATIMLDHTPDALWPFAFRAEQRFTLGENSLVCDLRIENRHDRRAPAGFGLHPYFPRSPAMRLQFAAEHVWLNGASDMIPVERIALPAEWDHRDGLAVGDIALDNCFAGWGGQVRLSYPDLGYAIDMTADPVFRHLVVYIPPASGFLAVEPVSNMNDGLNRMDGVTDHGVFVLEPGESRSGRISYTVEDIPAHA
jgi:aldose 1-epimerase